MTISSVLALLDVRVLFRPGSCEHPNVQFDTGLMAKCGGYMGTWDMNFDLITFWSHFPKSLTLFDLCSTF